MGGRCKGIVMTRVHWKFNALAHAIRLDDVSAGVAIGAAISRLQKVEPERWLLRGSGRSGNPMATQILSWLSRQRAS